MFAQNRDTTVLDVHKDTKGNTVSTIRYYVGTKKITETIIKASFENKWLNRPINPDTLNKDSVLIIVNKLNYNLEVYYRKNIIRKYKAVFGPKPNEDKIKEGDRHTPEGWFAVTSKNPNSHYDKFIGINYPNDSIKAKFAELKSKGLLAPNIKMGANIGIHGIWKKGDDLIEKRVGWTDGCIALKNKDIDELFQFVGIGTRVFIRK